MDLDRYVSELQTQLAAAAVNGDADTRAVAEQLNAALDAGVRWMLLGALSDVAGEITRQLAPGSVDVVLRGRDPHLVVTRPETAAGPSTPDVAEPAEPLDDTVTSRTTLRLPDRLKARVERAAADEGVSVNAWFVRAIAAALDSDVQRVPRRGPRPGDSFTGWAR